MKGETIAEKLAKVCGKDVAWVFRRVSEMDEDKVSAMLEILRKAGYT